MFDSNPLRVQTAPTHLLDKPTPLVLIHDGGGTVFSYFSLGGLDRDVWAIHNPKFFTAEPWEGGMDEMANHYIELIEEAGISGPVLLGGWSLGGYLSLAIAHILTTRAANNNPTSFHVTGLLIIDSPYHTPTNELDTPDPSPNFDALPELVRKSFDNCDLMLETWAVPTFAGSSTSACRGRPVTVSFDETSYTIPPNQFLEKTLEAVMPKLRTTKVQSEPVQETTPLSAAPPPGVLIKCTNSTAPKDTASEDTCRIDTFRQEPLLGWDNSDFPAFLKAVLETDADHYDVFEFDKINDLTELINQGLEILDSLKIV